MILILGFAPFILFSILSRLSADLALWVSFAAAFVVTIRDFVERPALRLLDGARLALFGLLAIVRTTLDLGLMLVIAFSLLSRRPFSAQYASGETQGLVWPLPAFLRVNYVISLGWAGAFAAMTLADGAVALLSVPMQVGVAVNVIALAAAITLSLMYPARMAKRLQSS